MKTHHRLTFTCITALLALTCVAATTVHADSRQDNKNFWRNATIASGAVAVYGLATHKDTLALAGAAGAAYSGMRYEQDRHSQSLEQNGPGGDERHWYYRHHDRGRHYGWRRPHGWDKHRAHFRRHHR